MSTEYHRPPVRVALMGLGRAMFADHYSVFREHPGLFKVVAACDLLKERRDIVAADFPDCKMFRQFQDMLDERDIDLVDIASCSTDHAAHVMASLDRGFWTLVESPFALTMDEVQFIRGAAQKAKNRLMVMHRGMFDPDYLLARQEMEDPRLGEIHRICIKQEDFIRRDDWLTVKRLGGGAAYYAMPDLIMRALKLLPLPPVQMWSELKRVASLGDAEDYALVNLKTREQISAEIEFNGAVLPGNRSPSYRLVGERGEFRVYPGQRTGKLCIIDPEFKFPRRRSSVRTPSMDDMHEDVPVVELDVELSKHTEYGQSAFWRNIYETVRTAAPYPFTLDAAADALKFAQLMKKTSPFGSNK